MEDDKVATDEDGELTPSSGEEDKKEEPVVEHHFLPSTLYTENVFNKNHTSVWGSWFDKDSKRWGYSCCHETNRGCSCTIAEKKAAEKAAVIEEKRRAAAEAAKAAVLAGRPPEPVNRDVGEASASENDSSTDDEIRWRRVNKIKWDDPPGQLKPRDEVPDATEFLVHFVRYFIGAWEREEATGYSGFTDIQLQKFKANKALESVKTHVSPLLVRINKGESLDHAEKKLQTFRETRKGMEGKMISEQAVVEQLDNMLSAAAEKDYAKANAVYVRMTLGNKLWNSTFVTHVAACTMKGAREYRRNRDSMNTYDMDPVSMKYMHALLKLVHFAQVRRPNDDQSKNLVL